MMFVRVLPAGSNALNWVGRFPKALRLSVFNALATWVKQPLHLRNNGEIVVKTANGLRCMSLGPPHSPTCFAYRNGRHVMVVSGSSDGSIPEHLGLQLGANGFGNSGTTRTNEMEKLVVTSDGECGDGWCAGWWMMWCGWWSVMDVVMVVHLLRYSLSCEEIFNGAGAKKWWINMAHHLHIGTSSNRGVVGQTTVDALRGCHHPFGLACRTWKHNMSIPPANLLVLSSSAGPLPLWCSGSLRQNWQLMRFPKMIQESGPRNTSPFVPVPGLQWWAGVGGGASCHHSFTGLKNLFIYLGAWVYRVLFWKHWSTMVWHADSLKAHGSPTSSILIPHPGMGDDTTQRSAMVQEHSNFFGLDATQVAAWQHHICIHLLIIAIDSGVVWW